MNREKELKPTIYGIGYNDMLKGWTTKNQLNNRIYNIWRHMLLRTTESYQNKEPTYKGTTVSEEWLYLSNFVEDIKNLPNYNEWVKNNQTYLLDKDVLGNGKKHYSKDTCCFLTYINSNKDVRDRNPQCLEVLKTNREKNKKEQSQPVKATHSKTNEIRYFESIRECARQLDVRQANVWCCLSNNPKYKSNKRVKEYYLEFITQEEYQNIIN